MSAQAPQSTDFRTKGGEEGRFRAAMNRQLPLSGPGTIHTTLPGGVIVTPTRRPRAARAARHPLQIIYAGAESTIINGTIGGITPRLAGGARLNTSPAPTIDLSAAAAGTLHVYAVVTATHTAANGFVYATSVTQVNIEAFDEEQADVLTGTYYILLGTVVNGIVILQPIRTSLVLTFANWGSGLNSATLSTSPAS